MNSAGTYAHTVKKNLPRRTMRRAGRRRNHKRQRKQPAPQSNQSDCGSLQDCDSEECTLHFCSLCALATHDATTLKSGLCEHCHEERRIEEILSTQMVRVVRSPALCVTCRAFIPSVDVARVKSAMCDACVEQRRKRISPTALYTPCDAYAYQLWLSQQSRAANVHFMRA